MTRTHACIIGSLTTSALVVGGCYSKPDTDDTDADASTGQVDGGSQATTSAAMTDDAGDDATTTTPGTTTTPVGDSGGTTTGPMATTAITDGDTGSESTGGGSTGGVPACADAPVIATLPGPAMTQCGGSWSVDVVTFQIQNSLHPTCGGGQCSAGTDAAGVWVYPAQLYADLTGIGCEASVVEVTVTDYTAANAWITLFDDTGAVVASDYSNLNGVQETVSIAVPLGTQITGVGVHGCETHVSEIRVL